MRARLQALFAQKRDNEAIEMLFDSDSTMRQWVQWEDSLAFVRQGFKRIDFWRRVVEKACPLLYQRLSMSEDRMSNAKRAVSWVFGKEDNFWRYMLSGVFHKTHAVYELQKGLFTEQGADEFGADWLHKYADNNTFQSLWGDPQGQWVNSLYEHESPVIKSWPLSFQKSVLFLTLDNQMSIVPVENKHMSIGLDMGYDPIIIQSEAGVAVIVNRSSGLRLFLDGRYQTNKDLYITHRVENAPSINAGCFVLDKYLLVQESKDLQMVAHPRNNPKSRYYLQHSQIDITLMVGLFNIVATVDYDSNLTIYKVIEQAADPFFRLDRLYSFPMIDVRHPPLLYGPFCFVRHQNGDWWRLQYDGVQKINRLDPPIDFMKMATWRYRVLNNNQFREQVLFINGQ